jgi:type II secretory pathway component PulF
MAQLSTNELIGFCRRVGMSLRSGVEVRRVWEHEVKRGSVRFRAAMEVILEHVKQGESIAVGMRAANAFPPVMLAMVEIGEHTGKLDVALEKLAEHYEHQAQLRRQFVFGIAWPSLQLLAAILVVCLLIYILDALGGTQLDGTPWDVTGLGLRGTSGVIIFLLAVGTILGGLATLVLAVLKGWFGTGPIRYAMKVPLIGPCLRHTAMSRLTWALGMALDAGMDAKRSVELSLIATQNPFYLSRAESVVGTIANNKEFYEAFRDAEGFPDDFLLELETAEIAGTLSESLVRMSQQYNERAKAALHIFTWACVITIWLAMGAIMVTLIFRLAYMVLIKPINDALKF